MTRPPAFPHARKGVLATVLTVVATVLAAPAPTVAAQSPRQQLDEMMSPYDGSDTPGAIVAVIRDGDVDLVRTYGMANLTHGIEWERGTISNIGSVTKQFTAMGLLVLQEGGKLSLDDDVRTYIPELPDFGETVTLRQLLQHVSGYREIYNLMRIGGFGGEDTFSREHAIAVVQRQPELQNSPNAEWNYNNTGFILLSLVVERVTGKSFAEHMHDAVFAPLGMNDTRVKMVQGELIPGSAQGYVPVADLELEDGDAADQASEDEEADADAESEADGEGSPTIYRTVRDLPASAGAGGIYTTIDDLSRWLRNFGDPAVGGPAAIEQMTTSAVLESGDSTNYGLGLAVSELGGRALYAHTGGDVAHRTYMGYFPELNGAVILMSNNAMFDLSMGPDVARLFFADDLEPEEADGEEADRGDATAATSTMSDSRKAAIAGTWVIEVQGLAIPLEVTVEDGDVFIQLQGQNRAQAEVSSDSTIAIAQVGVTLTFRAAPDGTVSEGRGEQGGVEFAMRRGERAVLAQDDLLHYAGRYMSDELETFMTIAVEGDGLVLRQLGQPDRPLAHLADDTFTANETHLNRLRFDRAGNGRVTGFSVSNGRTRDVWFRRR